MARPEGEYFKQRNSEHAGLFPRLTDTSVIRLVNQERVARLRVQRQQGLQGYKSWLPSAMKDIIRIP